ncbi:response regulator [Deinococcus deserti]|uniref:Putative response regulator, CheY n=1 Tax=Deinococcus deserti (strain DSM 17065 / CIP 109153 / LMG 22923 / VCD115) TaxID=546414 RepID=C1D263_DEIDV|nr:response regulator [Deinococcus deserti]ACO47502.1 putative response regulator, CheY [Deinococcus deserti VCD115]
MFNVLMVEDNAADVLLMQLAVEDFIPDLSLHVVPDGVEALAFLNRLGAYEDVPRPQLMLLDGNTPRKSAIEVLAEVRHNPIFAELPVLVFSGSAAESDAQKSIQAGATAYIMKPTGLDEYTRVVQDTLSFWHAQLGAAES